MANGTLHLSSPTALYHGAIAASQQRGRSSSMLSGMSGFTDDVAEDPTSTAAAPPPPIPQPIFSPSALSSLRNDAWRKSSQGSASLRGSGSRSGSGSGAASGDSSTRDPMSPAPKSTSPVGSGSALQSPIGPPPPSKGQRVGSR